MMFKSFLIALTLLISTCHWAPSYAQSPLACAKREVVIQKLKDQYGETLQSLGLRGVNGVMEVYASNKDENTWTIITTDANGMSCLLAAGKWFIKNATPLSPSGVDINEKI